jgi:hypothetical protein
VRGRLGDVFASVNVPEARSHPRSRSTPIATATPCRLGGPDPPGAGDRADPERRARRPAGGGALARRDQVTGSASSTDTRTRSRIRRRRRGPRRGPGRCRRPSRCRPGMHASMSLQKQRLSRCSQRTCGGRRPRAQRETPASWQRRAVLAHRLARPLAGGSAGGASARTAWPTERQFPPAATSNRACGSLAHGSPTSFTAGIRSSPLDPPVPERTGGDDESIEADQS